MPTFDVRISCGLAPNLKGTENKLCHFSEEQTGTQSTEVSPQQDLQLSLTIYYDMIEI